jgi:hypothetical protein
MPLAQQVQLFSERPIAQLRPRMNASETALMTQEHAIKFPTGSEGVDRGASAESIMRHFHNLRPIKETKNPKPIFKGLVD